MAAECLFEYPALTLEAGEQELREVLGTENVYHWGDGQVAIHCPVESCMAEMEQSGESYEVTYTVASSQIARAKCLLKSLGSNNG